MRLMTEFRGMHGIHTTIWHMPLVIHLVGYPTMYCEPWDKLFMVIAGTWRLVISLLLVDYRQVV